MKSVTLGIFYTTDRAYSIPFYHLRLGRDRNNPTIHTWNVHAHGSRACDLQSTYHKCQFLCYFFF